MISTLEIKSKNKKTRRGAIKKVLKSNKLALFIIGLIILLISLGFYSNSLLLPFEHKRVYVLHIEGPISYDNMDIDSMYDFLKNFDGDALLLYIDSPGGGLESYKIIKPLKNIEVPVVCYIKSSGTSAAYWICSQSDYIIAEEFSIVGSIGGIMVYLDISEFLNKTGINFTIIKTGKYKDTPSSLRKISEDEYELLYNKLNLFVSMFKKDVLEKRNITDISRVLEAEWFLGIEAKDVGLVDELGDYDSAIDAVARLLNTTTEKIVIKNIYFYKEKSYLERLLGIYSKTTISDLLFYFIYPKIYLV